MYAKSGLIRGIIDMKKYTAWIMEAEESKTDLALDMIMIFEKISKMILNRRICI